MSETINNQQVFSLKEVLRSIQKTLSKRYQRAYWMKAELNKLNFYSYSGHCYPDLVEKKDGKVEAQMRAIIWKGPFQRINNKFKRVLKEPLKDGISIMFLAKINFTPNHGLSLQILDIDPSYSLGVLEREKQETIERLKKEGHYNQNKKCTLPILPKRVAIISVETSKGYADFMKMIKHNTARYHLNLKLFPARLQGDMAVRDIRNQLKKIKKYANHFDVVTIIRGGGGEVGLSAFNDYGLAKEVATLPIPFISGIGHATNETIVEMVAYKNAITPTECAQFLLYHFEQADKLLAHNREKLLKQISKRLDFERFRYRQTRQALLTNSRHHLSKAQTQLNFQKDIFIKATHLKMHNSQRRLTELQYSLKIEWSRRLTNENEQLKQHRKHIALVNPKNVLKRGYSLTEVGDKVILPTDELPKSGTKIKTVFYQGSLESVVSKKQNHEL